MAVETKNPSGLKGGHQTGFSLLQMVIVVMVIGVMGAIAVFGITRARQRIRLTNSARLLASHLEKARVDSIRRHATTVDDMASLTVLSETSYRIRYDMDGNGTLDTRDITMDNGIHFVNNPIVTRFDWRGRFVSDNPTDTKTSYTLQYGNIDPQRTVDVTRSGDVTIDSREYLDDVPNVNVNTNLSPIDSGSLINGNNATPTPYPSPTAYPSPPSDEQPTPTPDPTPGDPREEPTPTPYPTPTWDATPTPNPTPTVQPTPTPSPSPAPCVVDISPSALSISKNGGSGTLRFTVTGGSGAVSYASGPSNLGVTQVSTGVFQVLSNNNSRGDFTIYFATPCGSRQVTVTVTN